MRKRLGLFLVTVVLAAIAPASPGFAHCPDDLGQCSPGIVAQGANDPACVSPGKSPVILVHGTFADQSAWDIYVLALRDNGYCTWTLDYGDRGTQQMEESVKQILDFARHVVLPTSSTGRISAIGHSTGGLQIRHMLRHDPTLPVEDAISLSGSHFGTDSPLAPFAAEYGGCPACGQLIAGSSWMNDHMNVGDLTPGTAHYTQLTTIYDEIITPYTNTLLPQENGVVTNAIMQNRCPQDTFEHVAFTYDPFALAWALNALATDGPAETSFVPPGCI